MTDSRPSLHYVRVSKTASTSLIAALESVRNDLTFQIIVHEHEVSVRDIPSKDFFFTSVRDPIARFVSGFLSRQRCGRPRYNSPWTPSEAAAFAAFDHPWKLGAALSDMDPDRAASAHEAMRSIRHVRTHLSDWFIDDETVRDVAPRCVALIRQENWEQDVEKLALFLGVSQLVAPRDDVGTHRNPPLPAIDGSIELQARENLRKWFAPDYQMLDVITSTLR